MYCVSVDFRVRADRFGAFVERLRGQAAESLRAEPGCRVFEVWAAGDRPGEVHLHEIYDDAAAFDAHLASPHFRAFDAETAGMVETKTVTTWDRRHD